MEREFSLDFGGYWNIKECGYMSLYSDDKFREMSSIRRGGFWTIAPQMRHKEKQGGSIMRKHRIERNLAFPSEEFRTKLRTAAKERGFRTEQAFILAACENELKRERHADGTSQMEARLIASMQRVAKEFQALFTLVHAQFALTNSLLQYVLTCTIEPPEDLLPVARARARLRYNKILRLAGQEIATQNKATLEEVLSHGDQH